VILLQDGQRIEGHIVRLDQTNAVIRADDGTERTFPRATIERVLFETITGTEVGGALIGWKPGVYELTNEDAAVTIYSMLPPQPASEEPGADEPADQEEADETVDLATAEADESLETAEAENEADDADASENAVIPSAAAATTTGTQPVQNKNDAIPADGVVEDQIAAAPAAADLEINVSAASAREDAKAVTFDIELSHPSETSVVLIYATIDGTAIDGQDYQAARGVMVIKAGETMAKIEAPLINDDISEEDEELQLFLTADPAVASVRNRKVSVTIEDDDQR
jgi:hypothetical protein